MAYHGSLSRMASSVRIAAFLGSTSNASRISIGGKKNRPETGNDLCTSFQQMGLSPLEARMSATFIVASDSLVKQQSIQEYSFPSLVKPVNITVPALYGGAVLEKDLPAVLNNMEKIEPFTNTEIKEFPSAQVIEKQAVRLIVIRRKKMKKHKRRKLQKKMKFVWMKVKQKREYRKEKLFQATQMARIHKYAAFDAAKYVEDVLRRTKEKPIPRTWKGKRLPEFLIKQLMEENEEKKKKKQQ